MLPRTHRLTRSVDYATVVRSGTRAGSELLVVHLRAGRDEPTPHVGFVVSGAVGNAVVRNRVKRRLRHLVAQRLSDLPDHVAVVIRANPPASRASYTELADALDRCLTRATRREERV